MPSGFAYWEEKEHIFDDLEYIKHFNAIILVNPQTRLECGAITLPYRWGSGFLRDEETFPGCIINRRAESYPGKPLSVSRDPFSKAPFA